MWDMKEIALGVQKTIHILGKHAERTQLNTQLKEHISNYRAAAAVRLPPLIDDNGERIRVGTNKGKQDVGSWMWEHTRDHHGEVVGYYDGKND